MESTGKQCDGGIVKLKNIQSDPSEKLHIKTKWFNVVAGRRIGKRKEDYIKLNFGINHNLALYRRTVENCEKRTQKTSYCKPSFVLSNSCNNKPV